MAGRRPLFAAQILAKRSSEKEIGRLNHEQLRDLLQSTRASIEGNLQRIDQPDWNQGHGSDGQPDRSQGAKNHYIEANCKAIEVVDGKACGGCQNDEDGDLKADEDLTNSSPRAGSDLHDFSMRVQQVEPRTEHNPLSRNLREVVAARKLA